MRGNLSFSMLKHEKYRLAVVVLLILASTISLILESIHTRMNNGNNNYYFLVFNLRLAWIPFIAAALAYMIRRKQTAFRVVMPICVLIWLIFFPNAPYLLTDFQHLAYKDSAVPLWFDVIILVWFAWTGLLLGIASLYLMQEIVADVISSWAGWLFAIGVTTASSIGVYLGRFLRWNSWDLLHDPIPIAADMYAIVRHPIANLPTYVFTILFTLLFLFIYLTLHLFVGVVREREKDARV